MFTPTVSYLLTWIGLSLWYFSYWNQMPKYSTTFGIVGTVILVLMLANALKT